MKALVCFVLFLWISAFSLAQTVSFTNAIFTSPLPFQSNFDTLIIDHCDFENFQGEAIRFENIGFVKITNSTFSHITNTSSTRAVICGKKTDHVILKNLTFDTIGGTAIRFPTDGEASPSKRLGTVIMDSIAINSTFDPGGFESNGIRVFHTDTLLVQFCTLKNITDNALSLGRNSAGITQQDQRIEYCDIHHNTIDSVLGNGIVGSENAGPSHIHHNSISNIALDGIGMLAADGDHGIYWQAPNAWIYENSIFNLLDGTENGNRSVGISIRTNARIFNNEVHHCSGNGIAYWNDHPGGGKLEINNNLVYETDFNGIYINGSGSNPNTPDSVNVLHNTVHTVYLSGLVHQHAPMALNNLDGVNFLAGNLLLYENIVDTALFIPILGQVPSYQLVYDRYGQINNGFVDASSGNYRLLPQNPAIDFVPLALPGIFQDFDEVPRVYPADAGCFEFHDAGTTESNFPQFVIFPNPVSHHFEVQNIANHPIITLHVYSLDGTLQNAAVTKDSNKVIVHCEPLQQGVYFMAITHPRGVHQIRFIKL